MPFLDLDGNRVTVEAALRAIENNEPAEALRWLSDTRRKIHPRMIVAFASHKREPLRPIAHPDMPRYRELDSFLQRAQLMLHRSDAAGAKRELEGALSALGWK